ncbi:MAG TPA: amidohydrolase [Gemmatimonadaceae bacterium]|jgi:amidohydrolase|nr:amidohydrolase [Gemmatimonadaceae bacterium]
MKLFVATALFLLGPTLRAQAPSRLVADLDARAKALEGKVVAWRRDIHQNPELGNREVRTAKLVADHLRALGLEVRTEVAHTGVVGVLKGGKPGPTVALRADMDALPVTEEVDLPFKSTVKATYLGQQVGVMHACGHDNHVAILMGVAELLAGVRQELAGSVKFIFQPAEEGAPAGERGGAELMIEQGALENPKVDAIFGLHVFPFEVGKVVWRAGGLMASGDQFRIVVRGRQTHGALPWNGIDPIVTASQIVLALQTLVSRTVDLTLTPAVVTVGMIRGGVRNNIVPDSVEMIGTIRTFDEATRDSLHARVVRTAEGIARGAGAVAVVTTQRGYPVTINDPALTERMVPTLRRTLGAANVLPAQQTTTAEDFSLYQRKVPGMFFFLGVTPKGTDPRSAAPNHSPRFFADEAALVPGMRALANLAVDFLFGAPPKATN